VGDLGDPDAVTRAVAGIDTLFHLGAAMSGRPSDFECSIAGTRNVVDAALFHRVGRLVHVSSLAVLHAASARANLPIREGWDMEPNAEQRGWYSRAKLAAEQIVTGAVKDRGLPAVILRPGEVLGHGGPVLTPGVGLRIGQHVATFGRGLDLVPLVAIDDVVDALLLAAHTRSASGEVFHLVDSTPVTQRELARSYLALQEARGRVLMLPPVMLYVAAISIEALCSLLKRSAPFSRYRVKSLLARRRFDGTAARDRLGWTPRTDMRAMLERASDGRVLCSANRTGDSA
jgi:nucleoside-diphosphate-sugar epimerase